MDLHLLFPAPRRAPEIVSLLGWLGAFCEASPSRVTHPRPAVRPREQRRRKKGKPTAKVPSREDSPTLAEVGGPGTAPRPARAPHLLQQLPSRASPRELSRSGTSPFQVNSETPGTLQALPFPRRLHHAHSREELAPRRNSWCVTQGVPHTACAWFWGSE